MLPIAPKLPDKILDGATHTTTLLSQPQAYIVSATGVNRCVCRGGNRRWCSSGLKAFTSVNNLVVVPIENVPLLQSGLQTKFLGKEVDGVKGVELFSGKLGEVR
jgi:hypothetical protein